MHKEILTKEQIKLLPLVKKFSNGFGLVGGTAFALYIGHRRSIDFDLFTNREFDNLKIRRKIFRAGRIQRIIRDEKGEFTLVINGVIFTFFHYPFKIKFANSFNSFIRLPDLLTLSAMKAYTLGRRAKWKDYVDLYFVMKKYGGPQKIIKKAKQIFGPDFNEKIFRMQLAYFKDIDCSEEIIYMKGFETKDEIIKKELVKFSLRL